MRFILNFIFFGILFYLIYLFFPDVFHTMVSWVNQIYEFLRDVFMQLAAKYHAWRGQTPESPPPPERVLFLLPLWMIVKDQLKI